MPGSKNKKIKAAKKLKAANKQVNTALSTLLSGRNCVNCGKKLNTKVSAYAANIQTLPSSEMDIGYCITCKSDAVQTRKLQRAIQNFPVLVNIMETLPSITRFKFVLNLESPLLELLGLKTEYVIQYGIVDAIASELSVEGCHFLNNMDTVANRFPGRTFTHDEGVDFSIIIFKLPDNKTRFAALGSIHLPSSVLIEEAKSRCLEFNNSGHRSGASTGFVFSDTTSHSLSVVTRKDSTEFVASPNSVNSTVVYDNTGALRAGKKPPGSIISRGIYNDMKCMHRLRSKEKAKRANLYPSYRTTLLAEMKSRIMFLGVAQELGLLSQNPFAKLSEFCKAFPKFSAEKILLEYACSTGEMSNYNALPAHTDGNTSHEVETLCYNGRVAANADNENADAIVKNWLPAFLYCCNAGVLFKIKMGKHIMHCNLTRIMHVADKSRNDANYSRASGPCGPHLDNIKF
ncbi:predicted protein [Chaetoceros tenuissimus]|uniref:Uncharacterized protein n=1 Tax=Chaetoceros tenuissimus TaxID=426638 RepID=A0AAD3CQZ8_9STRA|nr:predicted protein [Chaetoceros tenuissimus]GFH49245.1 predicted protein [Chaetoceros tenuissimus]GFH51524.1 predicted protein [Chaetoceros tenuissimus]GFH59188.1 predicted protein [Chaetoceros tenuissimus]GFH60363.1 predicted protein [Chaetoceros tenuissimus]